MIERNFPQILIIDDHPSVRSGIRRAIEDGSNKINGILAHKKSMIGGGGFDLHHIFILSIAFEA